MLASLREHYLPVSCMKSEAVRHVFFCAVSYSIAVLSAAGCSAEINAKFPEESHPRSRIRRQHQTL